MEMNIWLALNAGVALGAGASWVGVRIARRNAQADIIDLDQARNSRQSLERDARGLRPRSQVR